MAAIGHLALWPESLSPRSATRDKFRYTAVKTSLALYDPETLELLPFGREVLDSGTRRVWYHILLTLVLEFHHVMPILPDLQASEIQ